MQGSDGAMTDEGSITLLCSFCSFQGRRAASERWTTAIQDKVIAARFDNVAPLHVAPMSGRAVVGQPIVDTRGYLGTLSTIRNLFGTECGRKWTSFAGGGRVSG